MVDNNKVFGIKNDGQLKKKLKLPMHGPQLLHLLKCGM
jgi:hypothetical protein